MMAIHLASLRKYYPTAPILISARSAGEAEMSSHSAEFGIEFWLEDCDYVDALLRLLQRCETEYACICDHDTVLLASPDGLLEDLAQGRCDLVGIEERIRQPAWVDWQRLEPETHGWFRFAPGRMDATFLMFNLHGFKRRWGLRGVAGTRHSGSYNHEFHHGICERLTRQKYLRPYHTGKYGYANLLRDGGTDILWHQWMGSYKTRPLAERDGPAPPWQDEMLRADESGERAFLADYPALDLRNLSPAWGPDIGIEEEQRIAAARYPTLARRALDRIGQWRDYGPVELGARALERLDRWRRLLALERDERAGRRDQKGTNEPR